MCLILVAWQVHPRYPLVVAANRDEFFARPTAVADFWPDAPRVLAGRDLEAGGSWLGVTRGDSEDYRYRFAALTNFRDPSSIRPGALSRGGLVADFLRGRQSAPAYLDEVATRPSAYSGFNLLVAEDDRLAWYSNVEGPPRLLPPGIYGVSNHLLDTPWPKVAAAKSAHAQALAALPDESAFFRLLRDDTVHPDSALPRTGVDLEWERILSAAFVRATGYGTRCSTVLWMDNEGGTTFDEQTWLPGGGVGQRVRYRFRAVAP